jgi:hypothetical protein
MSEDMAATLAKLQAALWSGARTITIDGQTVQFESGVELERRIRAVERAMGASRPNASRRVAVVRPGGA